MKILYGVCGTGNGHITRAMQLLPLLMKKGEVDILISGNSYDIELPYFVKYRKRGLAFGFDGKGSIDLVKTVKSFDFIRFLRDVKHLPVEEYDLIISDFEPITAWACQYKRKKCVHVGNLASFQSLRTPRPITVNLAGELVLKFVAYSSDYVGFGFESYNKNILTPLIRQEIRKAKVTENDHYTVYLNFYKHEHLFNIFSQIPDTNWHIFTNEVKSVIRKKNCIISPVKDKEYVEDLAGSKGLITYGGFQAAAEALYMGKKLLVIPLEKQYEQECNAVALKQLGIKTIKRIDKNFYKNYKDWEQNYNPVKINYPDNAQTVVDLVFSKYLDD